MSPCAVSSFFEFLRLLLRLLEPVRDRVLFLLLSRLSDLRDEEVLIGVFCASTSDLSVMSSILGALCVGPSQGVQIDKSSAFHPVRGSLGLFLSNQSCSSNVRGCSLIGDCHHIAAAWEGNMFTGHEFLQSSQFRSTALENPRALEFVQARGPGSLLRTGCPPASSRIC